MANLHSTMKNGKGNTVSAINHTSAETMVETWDVRIVTTLNKDGDYTISIEDRKTGEIIRVIDGKYPASNC